MDGVHDLGGKPGFGEVERKPDEPVFHDRWEAVVFAMVQAAAVAGAMGNVDRFRHAIERIDPEAYLTHGYFGRWVGGLENLFVESGVLQSEDIKARFESLGGRDDMLVAARPSAQPDPQPAPPAELGAARALSSAPKFREGETVITLSDPVPGHTRLPEYARGRRGEVVRHHGGWVYPDTNAHGQGEQPQHLYTVSFPGRELYGSGDAFLVHIDLFEPLLAGSDG